MYHCHFEDVEHVQMGMTGVLFVRPMQNGNTGAGYPTGKFAYNDGDGSTGYDREFGFMLTEIFAEAHYRDAHIQVTDWTDFKAELLAHERADLPGHDRSPADARRRPVFDPQRPASAASRLRYQPDLSWSTANAGERVLLRLANLGYQNHAMTVDGIDLR